MSKYDGMNMVEAKVSESAPVEAKKTRKGGGFFYRVIAAGLILGLLFSLKTFNNSITDKALEFVKQAVTLDIGNKDEEKEYGEIKFIELIKSLLE